MVCLGRKNAQGNLEMRAHCGELSGRCGVGIGILHVRHLGGSTPPRSRHKLHPFISCVMMLRQVVSEGGGIISAGRVGEGCSATSR